MWKSLLLALGLLGTALSAQSSVDSRGLSPTWMDLGLPVGGALQLTLDAAGVAISPSEDGHVRVRYTGKGEHDLSRVRVRFEPAGRPAELRITHHLHNDFQIEIQVPRSIALGLRMSAGEVTIKGVEGDKDLRVHAGEVNVHVGDPSAYGSVTASVWAGEVNAGPFGESKEGLFRSFSHEGQGAHCLHVKLKAGQVTFLK